MYEQLGRRVEELLAGRPQKWLSERSGLNSAMISRLVSGKAPVTLAEIRGLTTAFEISASELLDAVLVGESQAETAPRKPVKSTQTRPHITGEVAEAIAVLSQLQSLPPVKRAVVLSLMFDDEEYLRRLRVPESDRRALHKLLKGS